MANPSSTSLLSLLVLGQILDAAARATRLGHFQELAQFMPNEKPILTRRGRLVLAGDCIAAHVEEVPDLVQLAALAAQIHLRAVQLRQCRLDFLQGVSLGAARRNSRG